MNILVSGCSFTAEDWSWASHFETQNHYVANLAQHGAGNTYIRRQIQKEIFHKERLDKNKKWSHKPGRTEATKVDASGSEIDNPLTANRDYQYFAYKKPCFFFCAHPKLGRQHSVSIKGGGTPRPPPFNNM